MILKKEIQQGLNSIPGLENIITDIELAETPLNKVQNPFEKKSESLQKYKSINFENCLNSRFITASEIPEREPLSTSMDFLFGGPFYRGEVTSIEGGPGVGKTRLCLKIAHEVACSGRVLYIDADVSLQSNIVRQILKSLNLPFAPQLFIESKVLEYNNHYVIHQFSEDSVKDLSVPSLFHIATCLSPTDLFNIINLYIKNAQPDLIIVDSAISLFQSLQGKNAPGGSMLQEFAIEFKKIVQDCNCVGIITNSLRNQSTHGSIVSPDAMQNNYNSANSNYIKDTSRPLPFLGNVYASLWHQRLLMFSRNYFTTTCELISSPRYPYQKKCLLIQTMSETEDDKSSIFDSF